MQEPSPSGAASPTDREIDAFQAATRDLIGIAMRSLDTLESEVTLPQFRLLLGLSDLGCAPSSRVADALGLNASSVTRLADRLHLSGHLTRGADQRSRSVVTLELTPLGTAAVAKVLEWRRCELHRILGSLDPETRSDTVTGLERFHHIIGEKYCADMHGPVPL